MIELYGYRPLVTPGSGATSGLWFSWVRWERSDGGRGVRSVPGDGYGCENWDDAAWRAVRAVHQVAVEHELSRVGHPRA